MEETKKGGNRIYIVIIALLLLIDGVVGFLLYKENKQKQEKIEEVQKFANDYKELNSEFETAKVELETLKGKNAELDAIIQERQAKIERYQKELAEAQRKGNLTAAELGRYKTLIAGLQEENTVLQKRVSELTSQNQELTAQNLELDKFLQEEKATTASLSSQKEDLFKKGSLFQLQNVKVSGEKRKKSGQEVEKRYLKNVEFLNISFTTGDNKVLEEGVVSVYVRVVNPKGETITGDDSGTLTLADGTTAQYSRKVDIDWAKKSKDVSVEWSKGLTDKGTYKTEIYQNGYLIGQNSVTFK